MNTNTTKVTNCTVLRLPFADRQPVEQTGRTGRLPRGIANLRTIRQQRAANVKKWAMIISDLENAHKRKLSWESRIRKYEQQLFGSPKKYVG